MMFRRLLFCLAVLLVAVRSALAAARHHRNVSLIIPRKPFDFPDIFAGLAWFVQGEQSGFRK